MSSDDSSGARPAAPIVLRIKLRYDDVETMVQRFAANVGKSGLFLPTRSIQPIGSEIKFELRLADETPALVGLGRVKLAQPPDPDDPRVTFGMAIELMRVTPQSRALILRMLERRREMGLPELGLPTPDDVDAARRAESGPVRVDTGTQRAVSGPLPPIGASAPAGAEALLTAPRRPSGPMAVAKTLAIAPLGPEPPRRKRPAVAEIIETASGAIAAMASAVPGLDDEVDLAAAIVRARALAGDSPDAELDALGEAAAAPLEISVEVASAELAKQLGGSAVRRDRSARWATPPATTTPAAPAEAAPAEAAPAEAAPAEAAPADEVHQLNELDMEDVEHTEMGGAPQPADELSAAEQAALAERLEAQLAEAEAEADADDLELARALGIASDGDPVAAYRNRAHLERSADPAAEPPLDVSLDEIDDFEILAEADADDEDLLAAHGEHDVADPPDEPPPEAPVISRLPSEADFAARLDLGDEGDVYYAAPTGEFAAQHAIDSLHEEFADRHARGVFEDNSDDDRFEPKRVIEPIFEPDPSASVTVAGIPSDSINVGSEPARAPERMDPHWPPRARPTRPPEPAILRGTPSPPSLLDSPVEDYELEHALEALDVDLDDLSIPHAATELHRDADPGPPRPSPTIRPPSQLRTPQPQPQLRTPLATPARAIRQTGPDPTPAPASHVATPRVTTDDGLLIDFEDDD